MTASSRFVEAYWCNLDTEPDAIEDHLALLDAAERDRAGRTRSDQDRRRFVLRRSRLRRLIAPRVGCAPDRLRFTSGTAGKPRLPGAELSFSVSHSRGVALFVLAHGVELGCDVEWRDPRLDWSAIAGAVFSPHDAATLQALPAPERTRGFFRCWSRTEAYVKARGWGLSGRLGDCDMSSEEQVIVPGAPGCRSWTVQSLTAPPGFEAAVAAQDTSLDVRCVEIQAGG